jgi:hypothetical protein
MKPFPSKTVYLVLLSALLFVVNFKLNCQSMPPNTFTVTQVPAENGSYSIKPELPKDGKVKSSTANQSSNPKSLLADGLLYLNATDDLFFCIVTVKQLTGVIKIKDKMI